MPPSAEHVIAEAALVLRYALRRLYDRCSIVMLQLLHEHTCGEENCFCLGQLQFRHDGL